MIMISIKKKSREGFRKLQCNEVCSFRQGNREGLLRRWCLSKNLRVERSIKLGICTYSVFSILLMLVINVLTLTC